MTAPTPSPEEFACSVWALMDAKNSNGAGDLIRARDASLTAPLREEVERLRENNRKLNERATKAEGAVKITVEDCRRQGVSLGRALASVGYAALEAENARLRAALQPFAEFGAVVGGNARDHVCGMYVAVGKRRDLHVSDFRAAAKALAPDGGK